MLELFAPGFPFKCNFILSMLLSDRAHQHIILACHTHLQHTLIHLSVFLRRHLFSHFLFLTLCFGLFVFGQVTGSLGQWLLLLVCKLALLLVGMHEGWLLLGNFLCWLRVLL